jgi:hypothetical protein
VTLILLAFVAWLAVNIVIGLTVSFASDLGQRRTKEWLTFATVSQISLKDDKINGVF